MAIAYCKIFPPIGIARVGDSAERAEGEGWFIDPGCGAEYPPQFRFKDSSGRIKRQGARFHIFAFDETGAYVKELTDEDAEITWEVELANRKSAWHEFDGAKNALKNFFGSPATPLRNAAIAEAGRKRLLEIHGGKKSIRGKRMNSDSDCTARAEYEFVGKFKDVRDVYLGEIRTDDKGRLIVLGGRGSSDAIDSCGASIKDQRWILQYANNDDWHDDTSDGPVRATVSLTGAEEKRKVEVRGIAWVLVAPPDFAPDVQNAITLYDVMEEVALNHPKLLSPAPELGALRRADDVVYHRDILPVLERMLGYAWVNETGLRGHGFNKPGFYDLAKSTLSHPDGHLSQEDRQAAAAMRKAIFSAIRMPTYERPGEEREPLSLEQKKLALAQASPAFMPQLSGDEGNATIGDPTTWLSVTHLQYARLSAWAAGKFKTSTREAAPAARAITCAVLDRCAGGAFFPGIEMTAIARHPELYSEAFRVSPKYEAGDLTKSMAVPWQADFYECNTNWWPAQRPDDVMPEAEFTRLVRQYSEELVSKPENAQNIFFNRTRWARGIGSRARPTTDFLLSQVFPNAFEGETSGQYVDRITQVNPTGPLLYYFLIANRVNDYLKEPAGGEFPSPWRLQYLVQEAFDGLSGIFFHLVAPPIEALFSEEDLRQLGIQLTVGETLRRAWEGLCHRSPTHARHLLASYARKLVKTASGTLHVVVSEFLHSSESDAGKPSDALRAAADFDAEVAGYAADIPEDSGTFKRFRFLDMRRNAVLAARLLHLQQVGDMEMVDSWSTFGFVRKVGVEATFPGHLPQQVSAIVETERHEFEGLSFRDCFYMLANIDQYPTFREQARVIVLDTLDRAQHLIDRFGVDEESGHPETFVEYSAPAFAAKLEEIYELQRQGAASSKPWRTPRTVKDSITRLSHRAPFNQTDGGWLAGVSRAGPGEEVRALLFEIWSDEIGNGDPALNHANLYTALLAGLNVRFPDIRSREYAMNQAFDEDDFVAPVFELAVALHSDEFFPEILGMTLFLEWEVLSLVDTIKTFDYLGIDSQFYRMHVGIDNATAGHGAKARKAVEIYLDNVRRDAGEQAVQEEWKRIWRGFVAFAVPDNELFTGDSDFAAPQTPETRVLDLIRRKRPYGNRNHAGKNLGHNKINDLFDKPREFLKELEHSQWIVPGNPRGSRLLSYLTTFDGPMYKVFDQGDLDIWREWILWLGREGDTISSKRYMSKAESMLLLLEHLRRAAQAAHGHKIWRALGSTTGVRSVAELFDEPDLKVAMRELSNPANGWIVPGSPDDSPLIVDMARPGRPMGAALDQRFPSIGNQVGRVILLNWIQAACPIPGETNLHQNMIRPHVSRRRRLLVEIHGKGAVH